MPPEREAEYSGLWSGVCQHYRRPARPAKIVSLAKSYFIVPDSAYLMHLTGALISMAALPADRYTRQVIVAGYSRFGAK
jgi:hypothetical protein